MNSVDFKTSLFEVPVTREEDHKSFTYYDYLMNEQKAPWWSQATKAFFGLLFKDKEPEAAEKVNPFKLTKKQTAIMKAIDKNVVCDVDKKTMVITINVTDQDALICATMADSVKHRLQKFITDYRTSKARVDLEYNQKLYGEAKEQISSRPVRICFLGRLSPFCHFPGCPDQGGRTPERDADAAVDSPAGRSSAPAGRDEGAAGDPCLHHTSECHCSRPQGWS